MCAERRFYGSGEHQFVDVYPGDLPGAVVLLHGGFWRARVGLDHIAPVAEELHARGHTVWNVEYRRVGQGPWPATLRDVMAAAWDAIGATEGPVVAVGHSAGGHLATWVSSRVRLAGVVSLAGVLTLAEAARDDVGGTAVPDFVGGTPDEVPDRYADADPVAQLEPDRGVPCAAVTPDDPAPPWLGGLAPVPIRCVHAPDDDRVPLSISRRYVAAASAAGVDARLVEVPGDHFTLVDPHHPTWPTVYRQVTVLLAGETGP